MIVVFTGAGISKASGLATFDEMPGIRQKLNREYLDNHPEEFWDSVKDMGSVFETAKPNDAHIAIAEYGLPVITMNVDGLHEKAGSKPINLHGTVPTQYERDNNLNLDQRPVLYGEKAPNYPKGIALVQSMKEDDVLLVIGASQYTGISNDLRVLARQQGAHVVEIQENAETNTRLAIEQLLKNGIQL